MALKKYFWEILLLLLLIILSPYFYISFFAHPVADDYIYSFISMKSDFWHQWKTQYIGWNGRYMSTILVLLNPLTFHGFSVYKTIPAVLIFLSLASLYYFIRAITDRSFSPLITINVSILLLLLYLFQMPSLAEGFYWYTGSVSYQAGIIAALVYLGLLCNYFNKHYLINRHVHFIITACMLFASAGFNEVLTFLLAGFHIAAVVLLYMNKKKANPEWWILFIVCLAGTLILVLAPGNLKRAAYYHDSHNLFHSLFFTFLQMLRFCFDWISNLPFILSTLLLGIVSVLYQDKFLLLREIKSLKTSTVLIFLAGTLFICIFPAYWETNILGQHRTMNTSCFFFILIWFISVVIFAAKHIGKDEIKFISGNRKLRLMTVLLIAFSIATTKNGYDIFLDVFYKKVNRFENEMNARYSVLRNTDNKSKMVYLKPLSEKPKSLFVLDLSENSTYWVNRCQAKYFGVKAISCNQ